MRHHAKWCADLAHVRIGLKLPAYSSEMNVAVLVWLVQIGQTVAEIS